MMNRKRNQIAGYLSWVLKKYHELHQELSKKEFYRLVQIIKRPLPESYLLEIQMIGTSKIFKLTPKEIIGDDRMLETFSKQDIRTITYLACEDLEKPKLRVVSHRFSDNFKKILFCLKKTGSDDTIEKSADEISNATSMINSFHPKDAHLIGYIYGVESVTMENLEKDKINNNEST